MSDLNVVILTGRLTKDAELRSVGESNVLNFSIAVNKSFKNRDGERAEKTTFVDCQIWGRRGEALEQYLVKGKRVAVQGDLEIRRVESEGSSRYYTNVSVDTLEFIGGDNSSASTKSKAAVPAGDEFDSDDDLPF